VLTTLQYKVWRMKYISVMLSGQLHRAPHGKLLKIFGYLPSSLIDTCDPWVSDLNRLENRQVPPCIALSKLARSATAASALSTTPQL